MYQNISGSARSRRLYRECTGPAQWSAQRLQARMYQNISGSARSRRLYRECTGPAQSSATPERGAVRKAEHGQHKLGLAPRLAAVSKDGAAWQAHASSQKDQHPPGSSGRSWLIVLLSCVSRPSQWPTVRVGGRQHIGKAPGEQLEVGLLLSRVPSPSHCPTAGRHLLASTAHEMHPLRAGMHKQDPSACGLSLARESYQSAGRTVAQSPA